MRVLACIPAFCAAAALAACSSKPASERYDDLSQLEQFVLAGDPDEAPTDFDLNPGDPRNTGLCLAAAIYADDHPQEAASRGIVLVPGDYLFWETTLVKLSDGVKLEHVHDTPVRGGRVLKEARQTRRVERVRVSPDFVRTLNVVNAACNEAVPVGYRSARPAPRS
ncbi:MAG: hypothetical protein AAFR11_09945 [Pseudomonadota bacterium]